MRHTYARRSILKTTVIAGALAELSAMSGGAAPARRKIELYGHRGAPALCPEHTLASYARAIADGADFIEPDLQSTKDGVLIALHEPRLSQICDVADHPEFADRRHKLQTPEGVMDDWFLMDLTYSEVRTLRLKERIPKIRPQNTIYDYEFQFVSFAEMIDFVAAEAATRGRQIGIVPELKYPAMHEKAGLPIVDIFLDMLPRHSYLSHAPLVIQCFEAPPLQKIHRKLGNRPDTRLMQLIDETNMRPMDVALRGGKTTYADMITPEGLKNIATYADIVAPYIRTLIPLNKDETLGAPHPMIRNAHDLGLLVGCYDFKPENCFIAANYRDQQGPDARNVKGSIAEIQHYLRAGIDGFFTDDPAVGRKALDLYAG